MERPSLVVPSTHKQNGSTRVQEQQPLPTASLPFPPNSTRESQRPSGPVLLDQTRPSGPLDPSFWTRPVLLDHWTRPSGPDLSFWTTINTSANSLAPPCSAAKDNKSTSHPCGISFSATISNIFASCFARFNFAHALAKAHPQRTLRAKEKDSKGNGNRSRLPHCLEQKRSQGGISRAFEKYLVCTPGKINIEPGNGPSED